MYLEGESVALVDRPDAYKDGRYMTPNDEQEMDRENISITGSNSSLVGPCILRHLSRRSVY